MCSPDALEALKAQQEDLMLKVLAMNSFSPEWDAVFAEYRAVTVRVCLMSGIRPVTADLITY